MLYGNLLRNRHKQNQLVRRGEDQGLLNLVQNDSNPHPRDASRCLIPFRKEYTVYFSVILNLYLSTQLILILQSRPFPHSKIFLVSSIEFLCPLFDSLLFWVCFIVSIIQKFIGLFNSPPCDNLLP